MSGHQNDFALVWARLAIAAVLLCARLAGIPPLQAADGQPDTKHPPRIVFIIGENEYHTAETLPAFARAVLEAQGLEARFVHAPSEEGNPNFRGYEVIAEADLLCVSVRRRTPPREMLALVRRHVAAGKPLVGLRTASHAFAAPPSDDRHAAWPEFDQEVLGGDYTGHYSNKPPNDPPTLVRPAPGALSHPVLTGLPDGELIFTSHLYKNHHPASTVFPLLLGVVRGRAEVEPVAWVNTNHNRRVFYTSLGSPEDFEVPAFRRLLLNGMLWALHRPIPGSAEKVPGIEGKEAALYRSPAPVRQPALWDGSEPDGPAIEVAMRRGNPEAIPLALRALAEETLPEKDRIVLAHLLAEQREERVVATLLRWLRHDPSPALKAEALDTAPQFGDERIARVLINQIPALDPPLRQRALAALITRKSWMMQLLHAVDRGPFNRVWVTPEVVLAMQQTGGAEARPLLRKHWGLLQQTSEEKQARVAELGITLAKGPGNVEAGRALFEQACSRCHTFAQGRKVGPDLARIDRRYRRTLLEAIVDPSRVVRPEFAAAQFHLRPRRGDDEERVVTGLALAESAQQIRVRDTAGATLTLSPKELIRREPWPVSLMPEGLLDGVSEEDVRDLFAYLER